MKEGGAMVFFTDKVFPQSKDAEQSVLGSMVIDKEAIFTVRHIARYLTPLSR